MRVPLLLLLVLACGCASPGVVQLTEDTYMLSRSSGAGMFTNLPKLKAEVIREAQAFAESKGKVAVPVATHDVFPAHGFPSFEYQFRLVAKTNSVGQP